MPQKKFWHFGNQTEIIREGTHGAPFVLLPGSAEDIKKVDGLYKQKPVSKYTLRTVKVIFNPNLLKVFKARLKLLETRASNPAFKSGWQQGSALALRQKTHTVLTEDIIKNTIYKDGNVNIVPMWHGTRSERLASLFSGGYAALATTDNGYFGKGIYTTESVSYAFQVYAGGGDKNKAPNASPLILNWVSFISAYPVVYGDKFDGVAAYGNYDAHFALVAPKNPKNPQEVVFLPPKTPQEPHMYTELVVFDTGSCLPAYLVELQPEVLNTISLTAPASVPMVLDKNKLGEYQLAAASGDPIAQTTMGDYYYTGTGCRQSYERAFIYYKKASEHYPLALTRLGDCHYLGQGTVKDVNKAIQCYHLAAAQSEASAWLKLAACYAKGDGVPKNLKRADECRAKAHASCKPTLFSPIASSGFAPAPQVPQVASVKSKNATMAP